ncbi:hypothetical protein [Chitinophaga cymbidii]|uniref:Uncharacterized protein n=1 Tax=Chitinophaga cymbidii TaxID=1096750 RepID=A0A512RPS1_9BACT|nr:hypothetical protein [Chitinophaga cymbidii]GEP97695.1 hypothetical protein CCY01nite_39550 [Chitinophaga cymbidii]
MKRILCICCLLAALIPCRAQGIFSQKKTQTKYLLQQIAKLQIYLGYAKQGYKIVNKGLSTISQIKNGDFDLHKAFFTGLETVSPSIKGYSNTIATLACIPVIQQQDRSIKKLLSTNNTFISEEKELIRRQLQNMQQQLLDDMTLLSDVLTDHTLQMSDAQRLERIDKIYLSVSQKKQWITTRNTQCQLLSQQRMKSRNEHRALETLYSLQ